MLIKSFITARVLPWLAVGLMGLLTSSAEGADGWSLGPLLSRFPLTLDEGERTEALGPLFYEQQTESQHTFAFPPFYSHYQDSGTDSEEYDFAYPVMTRDRFEHEFRWHFFQLLSFAGGHNQADVDARRFTIFPFYFQQRSSQPDLNYTAVFPFYGHLKNRLFKDQISFTAFPIYVQTRKRDMVTDNYFYPFYHQRRGDGLEGWQLWPFYGEEHKYVTVKTNGFGDLEVIPGRHNTFVAWPFYLHVLTSLGTENPEEQRAFLPFFSTMRSVNRDSTTVLWPLITWTDDRAKQYREWDFPWPLMVIARGEGKTITRIFPFFSRAHTKTLEKNFYLWPVYKYTRVHSDALDRDRTRILFFLYSRVNLRNLQTGDARTQTDLWPLYKYRHGLNGETQLQCLAPVESLFPLNHAIERNWSPLWSFWRAEKNPKTGKASQSLLWNLYRNETSPTDRKFSLLFGLFQYQSDPDTSRTRLFFIPLTKGKKDLALRRSEATALIAEAAVDDLNENTQSAGH